MKERLWRRPSLQRGGLLGASDRRILATLQHKSLFTVGRDAAGTPLAPLVCNRNRFVTGDSEAEKRGWHREGEEGP